MKIRAAALTLCSLTHLASADDRTITLDRTCVELDEAADQLVVTDRDHALRTFRQALERADLFVVAGACTETYRVSHERRENEYVIHVASSAGKRRMTTATLEDLSGKYGRLVRSLIDAKAAAAAAAAAPSPAIAPAPKSAVAEPAAAEPANGLEPLPTSDIASTTEAAIHGEDGEEKQRDRLWYALLGVAFGAGTGFQAGYRRDLPSVTIDVAFAARTGGDTGTSAISFGGELLGKTQMSPTAQLYAGGGLSLGAEARGEYSGSGPQGELTAGLRLGRGGNQLITQLDVTVPLYGMSSGYSGASAYAAACVLSAGLGW